MSIEHDADCAWHDYNNPCNCGAEHAAELDERDRRIAELEAALQFYADPDTYCAITFLADPPCGAFVEDYGDVQTEYGLEHRPGARARKALEESR